jgi:hypothetical protein
LLRNLVGRDRLRRALRQEPVPVGTEPPADPLDQSGRTVRKQSEQ